MNKPISIFLFFSLFIFSCSKTQEIEKSEMFTVKDEPFIQETHEAFFISEDESDNEVRDIAVSQEGDVWIATKGGFFLKKAGSEIWGPIISGENRGPGYAVEILESGEVLLGAWDGLYKYDHGEISKQEGPKAPISVLTSNATNSYALGPNGVWKDENGLWEKVALEVAMSIRDAVLDESGNLWIATDAGLYFQGKDGLQLYQNTDELISSYAQGIAMSPEGQIWVAGLGGVSIRENHQLVKTLSPDEGLSTIYANTVSTSPDGVMWVGTQVGLVRYFPDGLHSLLFSRRWLTNDEVNQIAFDADGNAWIATQNGVSKISRTEMNLKEKENYFYSELMEKHIRDPWICGVLRLEVPGDLSTWKNSDDDNDGEYTGGYLVMESFRYAVTKDPDALEKARKAFGFLSLLYEVTGIDGVFARTIVPTDWTELHDPNRTYTDRQLAESLVNDPRYKPVEVRWRKSEDGNWLWKGDTSSDEMVGHFMSYFYFYEYAAAEEDKVKIRAHVSKLMDALIRNDFNFIDIDGTHTRWGVWSPEELNRNPDWSSERSLNSLEMLAFLKFTGAITGDEKYERAYRKLIDEEGYLMNAADLNHKNPAWKIYFDLTLEGYIFPVLLKYEQDPEIKKFYRELADEWIQEQKYGENLINNLAYSLATGQKVNIEQTISFLRETPLDLIDWKIDHTVREDVDLVHEPILEEVQISELPPPAIRATVRWDKNPWAAIQGNPYQVREPVFWLWPYWMARYLEIIEE
jgi:streptogramin lyase